MWILSQRNRLEGMTWAFASSFRPLTPAPFVSRLWRKGFARGFAACVTHQQDVAMHSTQQCVKDGTVREKDNQTSHVTGRNRLERANGIGATETRVRLHRPVVPICLPSTEICTMSPTLPTPPKHYHRGKPTHHSSNDTRITQFISENHSVGN